MTEVTSLRPALAIAIPALGVIAILAATRRRRLRDGVSVICAAGQTVLIASMVPAVLDGAVLGWHLGRLVPGIDFALRADPLGVLFGLVASGLWLVTTGYNVGYTRRRGEHAQTRYFAAFAATLAATAGVAFGANLLTLFVFYEILTVATYPLVTHRGTEAARRAGRKYVVYTFGGGVLAFAGIVVVFGLVGSSSFVPGGYAALSGADPVIARLAFGLLIGGFGVKAALMPLHSWLPEAMVAPSPVSGLLHAVAVVKSGVFGIARVVLEIYGIETMHALDLGLPLAVVAAVTTLAASLLALRQVNLKRMLAYSTVSQLSYIVLGLGVLHPTALIGGLYHLPAHAVMKLTLFLCAGAIYAEVRLERIDEMAGIGRRMPVTMVAFTVAAMGMIGIPLTAGFVSKLYLVIGGIEGGQALFAGVIVVNGILKIGYFWPVVYQAFFETPESNDPKPILTNPIGGSAERSNGVDAGGGRTPLRGVDPVNPARFDETSALILVPISVLALVSLVLGVVPGASHVMALVEAVVTVATGGGI